MSHMDRRSVLNSALLPHGKKVRVLAPSALRAEGVGDGGWSAFAASPLGSAPLLLRRTSSIVGTA